MGTFMKRFTVVALIAGSMAVAPTALAQDAAVVDAYGGKGPAVVGVTGVLGETETQSGVAETGSGTAGVTEQSGTAGVTSSGAPVATTSAPEAVPSGSLPFTGLDLALIAAGGALLLGFGVAMRRLSRVTA